MLVTNNSTYNYPQYKPYSKENYPIDAPSTISAETTDIPVKKENIPNDIIKVDSQSYMVKSYKTYNKNGNIVVY